MTGALTWALVISALGVDVVRRRSVALALIALQSVWLGVHAISVASGHSTGLLVAGAVLLAKAVLLPVGLAFVVLRTREAQWIASERHPLVRLTLALAVALPIAALVPRFGLLQPGVERAAVGLVALGITTATVRRPAIFQLLGFLVAKNGLYLGALSAPGGLPAFVELGLVFDLVVMCRSPRCSARRSTRSSARATPPCWAACVTEALAIAVPALPAVCGLLIQLAPTPRAADRINIAGALVTAAAALTLAAVALTRTRRRPTARGTYWMARPAYCSATSRLWGCCGRSRHRPTSQTTARACFAQTLPPLVLPRPLPVLGRAARVAADRQPRRRLAAGRGDDRASALLVAYSGRRSALEAGWKYLVLTTFGLTVALVGILVLYAAGLRRRARDAGLAADRPPRTLPPRPGCAARVPADRRGSGGEDRLGAGAQLAARRAQRSTPTGQRAALRCTAAGGDPHRLARARHPRAGPAPRRRQDRVPRVRPRVAGDRGAVPLAAPAVEAPAGLLKPRTHGASSRLASASPPRSPPPASCSISPGTRSRKRSVSTPQCRSCTTSPMRRSSRRGASRTQAPAPRRRSASPSGRWAGCPRRRCSSASF